MDIAQRLRQLREAKDMSQGDIENETGLLRCYISRVENGHTVPAIETLEKLARALKIPFYEIFYEGKNPPEAVLDAGPPDWGSQGKGFREFRKFRQALARMRERDRKMLLHVAAKVASGKGRKKK
jgi:transcriptional regulator with XRE-family HTH domain